MNIMIVMIVTIAYNETVNHNSAADDVCADDADANDANCFP